MAATVAVLLKEKTNQRWRNRCTVTLDSSYVTGGEAITANQAGLSRIDDVNIMSTSGGYVAAWDQTNLKFIAYYADYDAVGDGALIQVPNTTDLSAVVIRCEAIGI